MKIKSIVVTVGLSVFVAGQVHSQVTKPEDMRLLTDGYHTVFWENGSKYYGEIFEGEFSGKGTMIWSDSIYYEGRWQNGMRHGKGTMEWPNGRKYEGQWLNGK